MRANHLLYTLLFGFFIALPGMLSPRAAAADPIILLRGAGDFSNAINSGYIVGLSPTTPGPLTTANTAALARVYPGSTALYRDTRVTTDTTIVDGLVSASGTSADLNSTIIGAYSYKGPDPDFTGYSVDFDLYFPQLSLTAGASGLDRFGFAVVDVNNLVKFWSWDSSVLTTGFQNFTFPFTSGAGAGGSTGFGMDPGFDLTQSSLLQISYRGTLGATYPLTPDGAKALWLGTHTLTTVPEPGAFVMLCAGMLTALLAHRRTCRALKIRDTQRV